MTTRNLFSLKRTVFSLLFSLMILFSAVPIGARAEEPARLHLVAAVFPAYDFARVVAGDAAEVTLLLPPGADAHSYEPTPQDMIAIQNADLFLYTGGESDSWLERVLDSLGDDAPETFAMADCVTLLEEERSQSMAQEHGHDGHDHEEDGHEDGHEHEDEHEEMDEHVWTSPQNAQKIVQALRETLCRLSPENAGLFTRNEAAYQQELSALDERFETIVAEGKRNLIVFGDRFPFRYFAAAYGLRYDAAFPGCSEDSEPSVKTIVSLIRTIREEQIPVIFYIEFSSRKTADILAEETGAKELLFHSCHTVSQQEMDEGASYLTLMNRNADALKEALN